MTKLIPLCILLYICIYQSNGLSISYVGNMGVLIASDDKVVIVDGFHKKYKPDYVHPSDNTVDRIIAGNYKNYDVPTISLVTHHHRDHFDTEYHSKFLEKNPESMVVASQQVINPIRKNLNDKAQKLKTALKRVPYGNEDHITEYKDISVKAFKCPHANPARHSSVQNLAFLIAIDNYSILHLGDTNWDVAESVLRKKKVSESSIDIAILPYWMLLEKNSRNLVTNLIAPKRIIATHIPPYFSDEDQERMHKEYPTVTLFTKLNEQFNYK